MMVFDINLIQFLCCPNCQGELKFKCDSLKCLKCDSSFIIKDDIAVLLEKNNG